MHYTDCCRTLSKSTFRNNSNIRIRVTLLSPVSPLVDQMQGQLDVTVRVTGGTAKVTAGGKGIAGKPKVKKSLPH